MCPVCIATAAAIAAGATSAGDLTLLVVKTLRAGAGAKNVNPATETKGEEDGESECCIQN
jgi:hypothetical protein